MDKRKKLILKKAADEREHLANLHCKHMKRYLDEVEILRELIRDDETKNEKETK